MNTHRKAKFVFVRGNRLHQSVTRSVNSHLYVVTAISNQWVDESNTNIPW